MALEKRGALCASLYEMSSSIEPFVAANLNKTESPAMLRGTLFR
jgi:hypothetical protein